MVSRAVLGLILFPWCWASFLLATVAAQNPVNSRMFTLDTGERERINVPLRLPIADPGDSAQVAYAGKSWPAQITSPGLLAKPGAGHELHCVVSKLPPGKVELGYVMTAKSDAGQVFSWHDTPGKFTDLRWGDRTVLRYVYESLDESSKERREETYKPFHHVFDPDGDRLLTKGPGGLYSHHRGLFFGFNRISYGDQKNVDTWHCTGDAHQAHERVISLEAGPVLARQRVAINWHGKGKAVFAREERELTVYHLPGGHLIDFASRLVSTVGKVKLDGDPQHAGFQFRAAQEVADQTKERTYYLRPDGVGKAGETRNWNPKTKAGPANLTWNAMSFVLSGQRYSALYLDHPLNPKEARYSERDYGRFGSYFEYELDKDKPLEVRYRIWVQRGEMTAADAARLSHDFASPVTVVAK